MALSALDRAKVALAAHLIFHGAKQNGVRASSADGCLVVEIDPSDVGVSVPGIFAGFTVVRRGGAASLTPLR